MRPYLPSFVLCSMLVSGCGPAVSLEDDDGGTTVGSSDDGGPVVTTTPPPPPPTTGPPPATSTTTATTADTTAGSESDTFSNFIEEPDGGTCVVSEDGFWHCSWCDVFLQDCPVGEKCMPWANDGSTTWNATRCSPIDEDPDGPGEPCTVEGSAVSGIDSCAFGTMCWDVDPITLQGTCVSMCTGSEDDPMCPPQQECVMANDGVIAVCLSMCNPLADDCEPSEVCLPSGTTFGCLPSTDGLPPGSPCEFIDACEVGSICLPSSEVGGACDLGISGCCTPWCDLGAPDPAAGCLDPGQICDSWWGEDPAPLGFENLGACATP